MTLKQFKLLSEEDFIYYLRELILLVHIDVNTYQEQVTQLELYIEEHKLLVKKRPFTSFSSMNAGKYGIDGMIMPTLKEELFADKTKEKKEAA